MRRLELVLWRGYGLGRRGRVGGGGRGGRGGGGRCGAVVRA